MKASSSGIKTLLEITSRKQFVNSKPQQQVIGCVIRPNENGDKATTVSLVRDGKTSLGSFSIGASWDSNEEGIVVPDIERLQGVLSAYNGEVELIQDGGMIRVKNGNRRTSLHAEAGGLAFPHSNETIGQWEEKSTMLAGQIEDEGYRLRDGSLREPFFKHTIACGELSNALRCDNINAQKLNQYRFESQGQNLYLHVGDSLKGQTTIDLGEISGESGDWEAIYEGGLEHIVSQYGGEAHLHFIDFRPEGQGIRLILRFDNGDWVFQASVLRR